jgi:hypothetical protein
MRQSISRVLPRRLGGALWWIKQSAIESTLLLSVASVWLSGCGYLTNVIAGWTTPASTISGSNSVLVVDPTQDHKLVNQYNPALVGENINPSENFAITLDFGFLRYLQAVDPFVIVYSEAWMGDKPDDPKKPEDRLRQVVVIKEGMAQNAKLPLSNSPILGPITLESKNVTVNVALKIVVLSRRDNEQTIGLINQLAGLTAAAAPQYRLAGEAAAAVASALVTLNRDKIEFEHTLTFYPTTAAVSVKDEGIRTQSKEGVFVSDATLRTGQYVIIKGESEYRVVPYQTWYYYLWPFNWFGHPTDNLSRREEARYELPTLPFHADQLDSVTWRKALFIPTSVLWYAIQSPFFLVSQIIAPSEWGNDFHHYAKKPTDLEVQGFSLEVDGKEKDLYIEKTYMVLGVRKTDTTYGTFENLAGKNGLFKEHGAAIDALVTTPEKALEASSKSFAAAFDKLKELAVAKRTEKEARDRNSKGEVRSSDNFDTAKKEDGKTPLLPFEERKIIAEATIDDAEHKTIKKYVQHARAYFQAHKDNSGELDKLVCHLITFIQDNQWEQPGDQACFAVEWRNAWLRVLVETKETVFGFGNTSVANGFGDPCAAGQTSKWDDLKNWPKNWDEAKAAKKRTECEASEKTTADAVSKAEKTTQPEKTKSSTKKRNQNSFLSHSKSDHTRLAQGPTKIPPRGARPPFRKGAFSVPPLPKGGEGGFHSKCSSVRISCGSI